MLQKINSIPFIYIPLSTSIIVVNYPSSKLVRSYSCPLRRRVSLNILIRQGKFKFWICFDVWNSIYLSFETIITKLPFLLYTKRYISFKMYFIIYMNRYYFWNKSDNVLNMQIPISITRSYELTDCENKDCDGNSTWTGNAIILYYFRCMLWKFSSCQKRECIFPIISGA